MKHLPQSISIFVSLSGYLPLCFYFLFNVPLLWVGRPVQTISGTWDVLLSTCKHSFPHPLPLSQVSLSQQPPDLCPMPQPGTKKSVLNLQRIGSHMPGLIQCECGWVETGPCQDASVRHATALLHLALPLSAPQS